MIQEYLEIGPIHTALPGAMKLRLGLYGELIQEVETQFGFLGRSIETGTVGLPFLRAQLKFSRVEPESALLLDRLFSETIEKKTGVKVNERIVWIREITSCLSELNGFLRYLARMSSRMGLPVLTHVILKHRESLLDLLELLTGSRFGYYYVVPGGVRYDLTEGFQERLEKWLKSFEKDHSRIEALFRWTHPLQNRLPSLGRVIDDGGLGFVSESAIETARHGLVSHVESRLLYALSQSQAIAQDLHGLIEEKHEGQNLLELSGWVNLSDETEHQIETSRGTWALKLSLNSDHTIKSLTVTTPSDSIKAAIAPSLQNAVFEDVPLILESLDFSIAEIDR